MAEFMLQCECGQKMEVGREQLGKVVTCTLCGRANEVSRANTVQLDPESTGATPARPATPAPAAPPRLLSLDQLRGYAIAGMIFVNYMGHFPWVPKVFKHTKDIFSYADTIAPLFIFVVGMGFRLSLKRRAQQVGLQAARWSSLKRYIILFGVGVAFYGTAARIDWWDALIQIALAGMLSLPFIDKSLGVRVAAAAGYLLLFNVLYFTWGATGDFGSYAEWMTRRSMNGGFLSPIAYAPVLLCGTIAYDVLMTRDSKKIFTWSAAVIGVCVIGAYITHQLIPVDLEYYQQFGSYWTTSKRWSVAPFIFVSTACAFLMFAFFYWLNDVVGFQVPTLTILGMNPLIIYVLQYSLLAIHDGYIPRDSSPLVTVLGLVVFYAMCYAVGWRLWRDKTIIKL